MSVYRSHADVPVDFQVEVGDIIENDHMTAHKVRLLVVGTFEWGIIYVHGDGSIEENEYYLVRHWTGYGWQIIR